MQELKKETLEIQITVSSHGKDMPLPAHATVGSAGMDLRAAISKPITIPAGERKLIPTGISMAIPSGYEAQIRSRSGLAYKHGVIVLNSPGTIDSDYRGEIMVVLINLGQEDFVVEGGKPIAQMVIGSFQPVDLRVVSKLDDTERGSGGFGSTG